MKMRNGFVSNSSSSSFIVISDGPIFTGPISSDLIIGEDGHCEFGWEFERWYDFESKLNFAYLQSQHNNEWRQMLLKVLRDRGAINISSCLSEDYGRDGKKWAYIDHQSSAWEGMNTEMFDSEEQLIKFLFCPQSYIQGGNDNV